MKSKQEIIDSFKVCRICGSECKTDTIRGPRFFSLLPPSEDYYERHYCVNNHFIISIWIDPENDKYYFDRFSASIGNNYVSYQRGINQIVLCVDDIRYECNYFEWQYGRSLMESEIVFFF